MKPPRWRDWNDAIGRATFSAEHARRVVYLAIDEEEIGRIGGIEFGLEPAEAYESFHTTVKDLIGSFGWPDPVRVVKAEAYPHYLYALAAQVVAAFQMRPDESATANAYWRRLREFLGQPPRNEIPEGLGAEVHTALWQNLKRWANQAEGERLGRVRLAEKRGGRRLVAEPVGQCLLRRADLEKLRGLFAERGRPDQEPFQGRRLKELVDDARWSLPARYFTKHGGRVLDDPDRFDAAWEQIEAEYDRFLTEERPALPPRADAPSTNATSEPTRGQTSEVPARPSFPDVGPSLPPATTTVRLEIVRGVLSGGLYRRGQGPLAREINEVDDVLWRFYLRKERGGPKPPHKPPHDDFLLTTREDGFGAFFEERDRCRAGDDVLLLVPEYASRQWLDDADPSLFTGPRRQYRPSRRDDPPGWEPLDGLPSMWLAMRFKAVEDLSGVTLRGKWVDAVDTRAMGLRAVGGLILRRGAWVLGAGPTVRVVGPGTCDHVLVDGVPLPLDASRQMTPDLGVGVHRVRLPASNSRVLRIRVTEPSRASPIKSVGWRRVEEGWPSSIAESRRIEAVAGSGTLHGPRLAGDWPPRRNPEPVPIVPEPADTSPKVPEEWVALTLAVGLRFAGRPGPAHARLLAAVKVAAARSANPLLRGLLRASSSAVPTKACRG